MTDPKNKNLIFGGIALLVLIIVGAVILLRSGDERSPNVVVRPQSTGERHPAEGGVLTISSAMEEVDEAEVQTMSRDTPRPTPVAKETQPAVIGLPQTDNYVPTEPDVTPMDVAMMDDDPAQGAVPLSHLMRRDIPAAHIAPERPAPRDSRRPGPWGNAAGETPVATYTPRPTSTRPTMTPDPDATPSPEPTESPTPSPTPTPKEGSARIYIQPSNVKVPEGEVVTLNLFIDAEKPVGGYTTLLFFNPLTVNVSQVREGMDTLLGYPFVLQVDDVHGSIVMSSFQGSSFEEPVGKIHLGYLDFLGVSQGTTTISLDTSEIVNTDAQRMNLLGESGATITVTTPIPPPP